MLLLSRSLLFYGHSVVTILIVGLIMSIVGYIVGRSLWNRGGNYVGKIEKSNAVLRAQLERLAESQETLEKLNKAIPKK